jgi:hypothetical protein
MRWGGEGRGGEGRGGVGLGKRGGADGTSCSRELSCVCLTRSRSASILDCAPCMQPRSKHAHAQAQAGRQAGTELTPLRVGLLKSCMLHVACSVRAVRR